MVDLLILNKFLNDRKALYGLMNTEPEHVPQRIKSLVKRNEAYEIHANILQDEKGPPFTDEGSRCFALFQYYQCGKNVYFPHAPVVLSGRPEMATYWLLWAFAHGNSHAFVFLHSLVPECFIDGNTPSEMLKAINEVLTFLRYVSKQGASSRRRWRDHVGACLSADIKNYANMSINKALFIAWMLVIDEDQELEPHEVLTGKDN